MSRLQHWEFILWISNKHLKITLFISSFLFSSTGLGKDHSHLQFYPPFKSTWTFSEGRNWYFTASKPFSKPTSLLLNIYIVCIYISAHTKYKRNYPNHPKKKSAFRTSKEFSHTLQQPYLDCHKWTTIFYSAFLRQEGWDTPKEGCKTKRQLSTSSEGNAI